MFYLPNLAYLRTRRGIETETFKAFMITLIIGLIFGFAAGSYFMKHCEDNQGVTGVTEYPATTPGRTTTNQKLGITIQSQGHLSGSISLPQNTAQNLPQTTPEGNNTPGQDGGKKGPFWALYDGDKLSFPVKGDIVTQYYDSKTGKDIGQGTHQITGETTLTVTDGQLQSDTVFVNNYRIGLDIPDPPPRLNEIGVYTIVDQSGTYWGGYYQRDLQLFNNASLFGRVWIGGKLWVTAGVKYRF